MTTLLGYPVFNAVPGDSLNVSLNNSYTIVGSDTQTRSFYNTYNSYSSFKNTYYQYSDVDRKYIYNFFIDRVGKKLPFWISGGMDEIRIIDPVLSNTGQIKVKYAKNYLPLTHYARYIYFPNRDSVYKVIASIPNTSAELGQYEELQITSTFSVSMPIDEPAVFLYFVRFDIDTLSIEFIDNFRSSCILEFKELQKEQEILPEL